MQVRQNLILSVLALLIVGLFLTIEWLATSSTVLPALENGKMTAAQQKLVDVFNQYSNTFSTLGVGIIGAVAFISRSFLENYGFRHWYWVLAAVCSFSALASVFLSQLSINMLLRSLLQKQDISGDDRFFLLLNAQYYSLCISLLFFILLGSLSMRKSAN